MKAIAQTEFESVDVFESKEVEKPVLDKDNEVLLRNFAFIVTKL